MAHPRQGRRRYYDLFSRFYDAFIRMHSRRDEDDTRGFLVDAAFLGNKPAPRILGVCCGTGSVTLAFDRRYPGSMTVGYDFSRGMLHKAMEKNVTGRVRFVEGDAAYLPFADDSFDAVTCSHALYELKGESRQKALGNPLCRWRGSRGQVSWREEGAFDFGANQRRVAVPGHQGHEERRK